MLNDNHIFTMCLFISLNVDQEKKKTPHLVNNETENSMSKQVTELGKTKNNCRNKLSVAETPVLKSFTLEAKCSKVSEAP